MRFTGDSMQKNWYRSLLQKRLVITALLLAQFVVFIGLIANGSRSFFICHKLFTWLSIYVALGLLTRPMKSAYKLSWMFIILLFPLFGGLLYLFLTYQASTRGFRKRLRKIHALTRGSIRQVKGILPRPEFGPMHYLDAMCGFPALICDKTHYFPSGEAFFSALLDSLRDAKKYIFLEYFIIEEGVMWNSILEILIKKAKEGVDVRIIYDDFGCFFLLPKNYAKILRKKGIQCAVFNPFRPFLTVGQNHRDHRKIVVIDGKAAFTGGANLADEYINARQKHGHWKDSAVQITGAGAQSFALMFLQQWNICTGTLDDIINYFPPENSTDTPTQTKCIAQPFSDCPMDTEHVYAGMYLSLIAQARREILITTPYLILDDDFISALSTAARNGVCVQIITPHIWDKRVVQGGS